MGPVVIIAMITPSLSLELCPLVQTWSKSHSPQVPHGFPTWECSYKPPQGSAPLQLMVSIPTVPQPALLWARIEPAAITSQLM
jgi:hypothetical protein